MAYDLFLFSGFTKDMRMEMTLEWRISFTRAEHILLNSLNAPKLRVYIFSLLLYKTYLAPLNAINEGHIRYVFKYIIDQIFLYRQDNHTTKIHGNIIGDVNSYFQTFAVLDDRKQPHSRLAR